MFITRLWFALFFCISCILNSQAVIAQTLAPLRVGVAGITHGHVGWILGKTTKTDVSVVGIYEPDVALSQKFAKQYGLASSLFYTDLDKMLDATKPEAVVAFGSIYQHQAAVEACAPRGIHVMVEKPLATTVEAALKMSALAKKNKIFLLTNYETSWYPTTDKTYQLVNDSNFVGNIRKVVIHDGHSGPKEIGVGKEFFDWLTDPIQNGGGALVDFGCYGANLMTYLMKGEQPVSVTAVTQQFKPDIYPKVDDEATIIVSYPKAQCIIQASWNWPFGRKDMEVYGVTGYIIASNSSTLHTRGKDMKTETVREISVNDTKTYQDPFLYFSDVIRRKIKVPENGLYSLENNVTVVKILEAARESAKTGKAVALK
ncbi:MAG: Gfo/Idh/MocA family oxidoreductase [Chryseolinea sp.]